MKVNHCLPILFILCATMLMACHSNRNADSQNSCKTMGEVQDFSGLDGCKLLIVTEDGKKLLPGQILTTDVKLAAGQKIRFDYRPIDMMSTCMNEDLIVEITCLKIRDEE